MPQYPFQTVSSYAPDNLIAGLTQVVSENGTLLAGQALPRGALLGRITASGKLTLSTATATDGSQVPYGILYDAYDATAGDLAGVGLYVKGEFNGNAMTFGAGQTVASVKDALRNAGIYIKPVVTASGQYLP
ncbi:MAG: head decoration protein [Janthinobacterium lividum]